MAATPTAVSANGCPSLRDRIDALTHERSLREPLQLGRRIDALEQLERWLLHDQLRDDAALRQRVEALMVEWEMLNRRLYRSIRHAIQRGHGADVLREWAMRLRRSDDGNGYDALDELIGGVLELGEPDDAGELEAEMVFYQPTPARHILDFIQRVPLGEQDVVVDLGAGLGHVTLLTAICTRARCVGIELQAGHVAMAGRCAAGLGLHNAQFIAEDVRYAHLSDGTVFYLYTPFTGSMLRMVLDRLRREAERRAIRVCTLGPCTAVVANEPWLVIDGECVPERIALFRSGY